MKKKPMIAAAVALLLSACANDAGSPKSTFRSDTLSSGRIFVQNNGLPSWPGDQPWVALEELRIGTLDGEGPAQFGYICALEVDESGRIFVGEAISQDIRVFEQDGEHAFSMGRRGEGPGEFLALSGLKFDSDGRLWTRDNMNMRYTVFASDGSFLFVHPMHLRPMGRTWEASVDSAGRLLDWSLLLPYHFEGTRAVWSDESSPGSRYEFIPILTTPGAVERDTLPSLFQEVDYLEGGMAPKPFSTMLIVHTDFWGRTWFANSKEYRIFSREPKGDTTLVFVLPAIPEPVTEEEKLRVSTGYMQGRRIPMDQILDEKPIVEAITSDRSGHILVFPNLQTIPVGTAADVFSDSGVFLGRVQLPVKVELRPAPVFRFPFLYVVTTDEFDVEYVVRLRLGPNDD